MVGYISSNYQEMGQHVLVFTGTYSHSIDSKNRLAVPADVRNRLRWEAATPETPVYVYVTLGEGQTLYLYPEKQFEKRAEQLDDSEMDADELLEYERLLFSLAARCELDAQGRIRIPENLLQMARLGSEVVVIGVKDHLEIHNREAWTAYVEQTLTANPGMLMNPRRAMRKRKSQDDAGG